MEIWELKQEAQYKFILREQDSAEYYKEGAVQVSQWCNNATFAYHNHKNSSSVNLRNHQTHVRMEKRTKKWTKKMKQMKNIMNNTIHNS